MRLKQAVAGRILFTLCLWLAIGCGAGGGDSASPSDSGNDPVVETIQVTETDYRLEPEKVTLDKPGTYVFVAVNRGGTAHALEIEGEGIEEETAEVKPGQRAELKLRLEPGTYELYCPVGNHADEGMEGVMTVKHGSESH